MAKPETFEEFIAKHKIRRDGWCQECGRWPTEKGGKCRVVEWFEGLTEAIEGELVEDCSCRRCTRLTKALGR